MKVIAIALATGGAQRLQHITNSPEGIVKAIGTLSLEAACRRRYAMEQSGMIGRRLRMHGLVQGVSYRDWAVRAARSRGLTGWVRNRRDGSVEALVVGEPDAVDAFTADCRRGPVAARVDRVDQQVQSALPIEGFTILPTETVPHGDRDWLRWP